MKIVKDNGTLESNAHKQYKRQKNFIQKKEKSSQKFHRECLKDAKKIIRY